MASGRPSVTHGAISAFVMNACLVIMALAGTDLFLTLREGGAYGYPPTAAAKRATRAEIEHIAVRLLPNGLDRRRGWEALVARELRDGDPRAARGFVLAAQTLLAPADAGRIDRQVGSRASDAEIAAAAEELLSNETRGDFSEAARWMAQSDASDRDPAAFLVLGEERDLAQQARDWLSGRDPDHLTLVLVGVGAALGEGVGPRVALGASALKDALRASRLSRGLAHGLEAAAARAAPPAQLRAALLRASADPAALADEGRAAADAFRSVVNPAGMAAFKSHLEEVGDMAAATSSRGAARLLAQARDVTDLPRLRLVAQSGGDRAVAVAKRLRDGEPLADAAHGSIHWTQPLVLSSIALGCALLGLIGATLMALVQALGDAWFAPPRRKPPPEAPQTAMFN
ncbi:MAG: hypothetical protein JNJ73_17800 [Hyphomonadaceae bacterium]|nr:hypothetical protein [Hyphomonadaceae bacterium]